MKKVIQKIICISVIFMSMLAALYIGLSVYYKGGFTYGTWVNAVYCTGKTVSQINTELIAIDTYDRIVLELPDGTKETISMDEIGYQADYTQQLQELKETQNTWGWYKNLSAAARHRQIAPVSCVDRKLLTAVLSEREFVKNCRPDKEYRVFLQKTDKGYVLVNEREQVLDYEACVEAIETAILNREACLNLLDEGCYVSLPLTEKMQGVIRLWEKIEEFQNCGIIYQFGDEQEKIDGSVTCKWLVPEENLLQTEVIDSPSAFQTDAQGALLVNQEELEAYVDRLGDKYDTAGGKRLFQSTRGDVVEITGGTYGNQIDREAEKVYLYQAFMERKREIREPIYSKEAWEKGINDIGTTYIEVDMGTQNLYYYKNGKLILESPIVTGDIRRRRATPSMVCYVYAKQKNRVLRGPGYASPVKYWMPVKGGIGIHDARWRKGFGEDIYLTDGSHGCINMPLEKAELLFEEVEIGMPVVMFY